MKKFFYLFFIVAAFLTLSISCSKAEQDTEIVKPSEEKTEPENATTIRFCVSLASEGGKATIGSDGKVTWDEGDKVTVYAVDDGGGSHGKKTVPVTNISKDGTEADIVTELPAGYTYYAAFPECENATFNGDVMTVSEPAATTAQTNSNCQVAVSKAVKQNGDYYLHFTNVNALIKFYVSKTLASTVKSAELVSQTSDEAVSYDKVSYDFANGTSTKAGSEVTSLNRTVVEGDNFIALAPGVTMSGGFCLKLKDSTGKIVKLFFYDTNFTTERNGGSNISDFENRLYTNLSKDETANCYLINKPGTNGDKLYCFDATVKGNGKVVNSIDNNKVLSPNTVTKLWSTYNTVNEPESKDSCPPVVTLVTYHKAGYASFEYGRHGNVILAAKNASDKIIWSWHLWLPDHNVHEVIHQKTSESSAQAMSHKYMLNANLGALYTTADGTYARDFGFYYQWGRKDPFVGIAKRDLTGIDLSNINSYCAVCGEQKQYINRIQVIGGNTARLDYTIEHPTTFIRSRTNSSNLKEDTYYPVARDWFGTSQTDPVAFWQTTKTIYDPCPPGYKVPTVKTNGPFNGFNDNTDWDTTGKGRKFKNKNNEDVWFPAAGFLHRCSGNYSVSNNSIGVNGGYWGTDTVVDGSENWGKMQSYYWFLGSGTSDSNKCAFNVDDPKDDKNFNTNGDKNAGRGTGRSVRCVKE